MTVRVHINLQLLNVKCGINTYETEITSRLLRYEDIEADPFFFAARSSEPPQTDFPVRRVNFPERIAFSYSTNSLKSKALSFILRLPHPFVSFNRVIRGRPEDVYVFFENAVPLMRLRGKIIAVLLDLIPLRVKSSPAARYYFRKRAEALVSRADRIVTISEYSKKDIADEFHVDPGKIDIVYCAIDDEKFSREKSSAEYLRGVRSQYGLPEKFILHFGSCAPQKNVTGLLRAYAMLPESVREEYSLVITNPNDEVRKLAGGLGISDRVIYAENIPDEDKPGIYQLALLSAWPSYVEGFGLPILESQAAGVPVISSNTSSMPEVGGDSVIYFDPDDITGMSEAMRKCLTDENLHSELVSKGYENVKRFSWDKSAEKLHDIIISL